jgi:hypothetical protein
LQGADNQPAYYTSTMKVGVKLLCFIPFLGDMGISGLTTDLTNDIKRAGGNEVRIVQGTTEAYFLWLPAVHLGDHAGHQHRRGRVPPGSRHLCEGPS